MSYHSNRRDFLKHVFGSAAVLSVSGCANGLRQDSQDKPNIIFILADDLGYGDLGCYGQTQIKTPYIDQMAAQGMRFTDHYAGCTVCAPSRCSLMTGLHTGHTYVRGNKEIKPMGQLPLLPDTVTMPKVLKKVGYTTALTGKWGLGGPDSTGIPNKQGFDTFFGYLCQRHAHNYYPEFLFRNEERIPLPDNKVANPREDGAGVAVERGQYSHDMIADEALKFIEKNKDCPFFLYMAVTLPHANNEAGKKGMEIPDYGIYKDKDWPEPQKGHAAMISRLDRDLGRVIETLKRLGIDKKTLVLFTSDNGPHREGGANPEFFDSNGPLRGNKRDLYEGGIRVPLIARWPGKIQAGTVSHHISAFWDFLPTFAELTGAECPSSTDGLSMLPTLLGQSGQQKLHEFLYWEFHESGSKQAVRMGDWKAVQFNASGKLEFYNLKEDIGEENNIAGDHPDIVAEIKEYLKTARTESEFWSL
ncbi:MAG: arylsulfatase [Sedimentisphaerales bacterium]|nr:arylsulfatase [Sedimentisphaerales bacterium]